VKAEAEVINPVAYGLGALTRHWLTIIQLALVVLVVHVYDIEGDAFAKVALLTAGGFIVSILLPATYRLQFFTLLSIVGVFVVLGVMDGAWLLVFGLSLIGLCHLPIRFGYRVALIVLVGVALAGLRAGLGAGSMPWSAAMWPILGSMFMFRLALYLRAVGSGQAEKGFSGVLAYFFMLPNVAFPLFPVVDYQTFRRTHFDRNDAEIYETGMLWISRGILHLVLYRFVYYNVLNDPGDVRQLSDLVQYMLSTFLLYLRVSGQFHLIVGLLHLFGFRLPETHKLYYLAHSFTELWRRINIYWTDFMMKMVFYPTYFRLKKLGPVGAAGLATAAVFVTTWITHSYQWFWLRGGFPMTLPDVLFWGILGAFVVWGALRELKAPKARKAAATGWSWQLGLKAALTFFAFCFLWSLWSATSAFQWVLMLGAVGNPDLLGFALLAGIFITIFFLGGKQWAPPKKDAAGWVRFVRNSTVRTFVPLILLLLLAQPWVQGLSPPKIATTIASLQTTGLNASDAARKHRGYYEQLDVRGQLNAAVAGEDGEQAGREDWKVASDLGLIRDRKDAMLRDLNPSMHVTWNGHPFTTNSMGMRDREYALAKPEGTLRIALLGPSHVMGNNVADNEVFEQIVEERLNREWKSDRYRQVEILNFGVDGYSVPQQLALLEDRALKFTPDLIIFTQYHRGEVMTEGYILNTVWNDLKIGDPRYTALLEEVGLANVDRGRVAVPFDAGRALAKLVGVDPRMPQSEAQKRAHWIANDVNDWAITRIAEVAKAHNAKLAMLGLNVVIDDTPAGIPNLAAAERAGIPVLDLFHVFPDDQRAALRVAPWDEHPNATGHKLIADALYEKLVPILNTLSSN
jgi:lysophospholipase L1-like esterase